MSRRGTGRLYLRGDVWWLEIAGQRMSTNVHGPRDKRGNPPAAAEVFRAAKLTEMGRGEPIRRDTVTFDELAKGLETHYQARGKVASIRSVKYILPRLRKFFGGWKAQSITTQAMLEYAVQRRDVDKAAVDTINLELAYMQRMFSLAFDRFPHPPKIQRLPGMRVRQGFIDDDAYENIRAQINDPDCRDAVHFLKLTGWRLGEALALQWAQVNWTAKEIRLETSKNGQPRMLSFSNSAQIEELLTDRAALYAGRITPWVFNRNGAQLTNRQMHASWEKARDRAGYPGAILHDLRRTMVMAMERAGVPRTIAMSITGHKSEAVYARYGIANKAGQDQALEALAKLRNESNVKRFKAKA